MSLVFLSFFKHMMGAYFEFQTSANFKYKASKITCRQYLSCSMQFKFTIMQIPIFLDLLIFFV